MLGGEGVLDKETGLVWEQSPGIEIFVWEDAQNHCNKLTKGNRMGWRLPTIQELASLVDPTQSNPSLPAGHSFNNVLPYVYWSATTSALDTATVWNVFFGDGRVYSGDFKSPN